MSSNQGPTKQTYDNTSVENMKMEIQLKIQKRLLINLQMILLKK